MSDEGLPYSETGIQIDPPKSLGGKALPSGWPSFPSVAEADKIYEGFKRGEELMVDKYSYELAQGDKRLLYLAVEHPGEYTNHPQFNVIKEKFREFKPQVVLIEGQLMSDFTARSEAEAVEIDEEVGFVRYLTDQHNAALAPGEEPIEIKSGDTPNPVWVQEFQKRGYSNEDVAVYVLARNIYGTGIRIKRNKEMSETDKATELNKALDSYRKDPVQYIYDELPRTNGRKWKPRHVAREARRLTGQDISLDLDYTTHPVLSEMREVDSQIRDAYIVKEIEKAVRDNDRVLTLMGGAHPVRQEAALRQLFDSTETAAAVGLPKSLGGKDLPPGWPSILPEIYVEEANRDPADTSHMQKHSYELTKGDHQLLYLAAAHDSNPNHPQVELIKRKLAEFKPEVVIYESDRDELREGSDWLRSEEHALSRTGEKGLLLYLIQEHNAHLQPGEAPIRAIPGDIPEADWDREFRKRGYTKEDVEGYDLARQGKARRQGRSIAQDLFSRMFKDESGFRDAYQVKKIAETVRGNKRVLAMMGSSHPIRQEAALLQLFE